MARADEATRFQPGQSGNPKGRPKDSRHKLSEAALRALCANFQAGGAAAMSAAGFERRDVYICNADKKADCKHAAIMF
jgi:uncharacterized protein DUF5681